MDFSASYNLNIYNKIVHVLIYINLILGGVAFIIGAIVGIATWQELWGTVLLIGVSLISISGILWCGWTFTKGFQRIVEASEKYLHVLIKN